MAKKDPRVDAYIAKSRDFAQPILRHVRAIVHEACPEIEETIKWGMPFFMYHGNVCHMAAFKQHCAIGFWSSAMADDVRKSGASDGPTGHFGRFTAIADLPKPAVLKRLVKKAAKLNAAGNQGSAKKTAKKRPR